MAKRSRIEKPIFAFLIIILGGFFGYSMLIEPHALTVETNEFSFGNLPDGFDNLKIVFLADFHAYDETSLNRIKSAVDMTNSLTPDIVILGGDFVSNASENEPDPLKYIAPSMEIFKQLKAKHGIFAVLGNHDFHIDADAVAKGLTDIGVTLLRNSHKRITINKKHIYILGIDDLFSGGGDIKKSQVGMKYPDAFTILVSHMPEAVFEAQDLGIDLVLSGHTHGGQVRVPFYMKVIKGRFIFSDMIRGRYDMDDTAVYVSRGIGTSILPMRFLSKPEVTKIVLSKK